MPDRHQRDKTTFRPPDEVKTEAQRVLAGRDDWTLNDFLVACMVLLTRNPDAMLDRLKDFRPPPKKGRPRKSST
ncbi:hypothetical protein ACH4T9_13035 [Micromonospora sp. NPDC020750]|uniref:hypothetical protein n=1 Tax=unclassified Micromonospora TaxID=2617518 RepID=UPI0037AEA8EE